MIKRNKLLIIAILLTAGWNTGNAQMQENIERKQLFDYKWKFALGVYPTASTDDFDDSRHA